MTLNDDLILYLNTGIINGKCGIRKSTIKNTENNFGRCKAAITASFRGNKRTARSIKTSNYKNRWHTNKREKGGLNIIFSASI